MSIAIHRMTTQSPDIVLDQKLPGNQSRHAVDTALMMTLACVLIVNSHLKSYYPRTFLAADGLLGNSMFFLLSGFRLQLSHFRERRPFFSYYLRRLIRIYPATILCVTAFALCNGSINQGASPIPYIKRFIYPTSYTYIRDIIPFYALFYILIRYSSSRLYLIAIGIMGILYLIAYIPDARTIPATMHLSMGVRQTYAYDAAYFQVMLLGGYLATRARLLGNPSWFFHFGTMLLIFFYMALKYVMVVEGRFAAEYGLLHLCVFFICGGLLISLTSDRITDFYRAIPVLNWTIATVSALTLEIYLVHLNLVGYPWLYSIRFPANVLALGIISVVIAMVLARVCKPIQRISQSSLPNVRASP